MKPQGENHGTSWLQIWDVVYGLLQLLPGQSHYYSSGKQHVVAVGSSR
jgi:hypothetical protein